MTEPEVPAEAYRAAEAAYDRNIGSWVDGWVDPFVAVRAVAARVWSLAYTAGRDSIHTEWADSLTDGMVDDEETLKARRHALARRLVEAEIRAEVAAEIRAATRDEHVGKRLAAWLRDNEGGGG